MVNKSKSIYTLKKYHFNFKCHLFRFAHTYLQMTLWKQVNINSYLLIKGDKEQFLAGHFFLFFRKARGKVITTTTNNNGNHHNHHNHHHHQQQDCDDMDGEVKFMNLAVENLTIQDLDVHDSLELWKLNRRFDLIYKWGNKMEIRLFIHKAEMYNPRDNALSIFPKFQEYRVFPVIHDDERNMLDRMCAYLTKQSSQRHAFFN